MTIEEFIAARLDEDEAAACAATRSASGADWHYGSAEYAQPGQGWVHNAGGVVLTFDREGEGAVAEPVGIHIARHDPARVLRQVAALRRLVALHRRRIEQGWGYHSDEIVSADLGPVAAIWSGHPDFQPEWNTP